ncbi:MAG: hypothetical protein IAF08_08090 [Rhizobacter sp.]|nr:hypothetical protein [Chlorobiales bacterium]
MRYTKTFSHVTAVALLLIALFSGSAPAFAQPASAKQTLTVAPFKTGTQYAGGGLGIGGLSGFGGYGMIGGQWEIGVGERIGAGYIGVGALGGIYFAGPITVVGIGGQGNYHFDMNDPRIDLFAGLNLLVGFDSGATRLYGGINAGGRYLISQQLAVFGRLGFGYTSLMIGLDINI